MNLKKKCNFLRNEKAIYLEYSRKNPVCLALSFNAASQTKYTILHNNINFLGKVMNNISTYVKCLRTHFN